MVKNKKVLIMEDLAYWGELITKELKKAGIASKWMTNGLLGVQEIEKEAKSYDGIITDVQMPIMSGLEATRKIREGGFVKPIVGFSSLSEEEDRNKGLAAGMDKYFIKSIDPKILNQIVDCFLL